MCLIELINATDLSDQLEGIECRNLTLNLANYSLDIVRWQQDKNSKEALEDIEGKFGAVSRGREKMKRKYERRVKRS